jgi:hypothetical protein
MPMSVRRKVPLRQGDTKRAKISIRYSASLQPCGAGRRLPAVSPPVSRGVTRLIWRGRGVFPCRGRAHHRHRHEPLRGLLVSMAPIAALLHTARSCLPRERVWRARTAPGTISSIYICPSSLCKECLPMSHTATLRTLIQSPDLLVMPGVFDGFSARLVEHSGFAAGFISG